MQDFINNRKSLAYLYYGVNPTADDMAWLSQTDLSNVISTRSMFEECTSLTTVIGFPTSNVTNMSRMFYNCRKLINIPDFDTSKVTDMSSMFFYCASLSGDVMIDTSSCTDMSNMFDGCTNKGGKLILTDTSKVVNMSGAFFARPNLSGNRGGIVRNSEVDTDDNPYMLDLDISSCNNIGSAFVGYEGKTVRLRNGYGFSPDGSVGSAFQLCQLVTTMHLEISTPKSTTNMFYNCYGLKKLSGIDMRNTTSTSSMFSYCYGLEELYLKNIKASLQISSSSKLTTESLIGLCYELRDTGSVKTLTVGSANLTKLANVYVKSVTITDEMRAADDLIDEKLPFEVCESADEGATLLSQYVTLKNWKLA
jgi:surface protein